MRDVWAETKHSSDGTTCLTCKSSVNTSFQTYWTLYIQHFLRGITRSSWLIVIFRTAPARYQWVYMSISLNTNKEYNRSVGELNTVRLVQMIRCRFDASHKTSPAWENSSSTHLSPSGPEQLTIPQRCSHSSEIKPHYHERLCLFIAIVAHEWALLSYLTVAI